MTYSLHKVAEAEAKAQAPAEQTPAPTPEKPGIFSKAWGKTKQIGKDIGTDS